MHTSYVTIEINIDDIQQEIAAALLEISGFDTFAFQDGVLRSSILAKDFDEDSVKATLFPLNLSSEQIQFKYVEDENWNKTWESNYSPILIENFCQILATFHSPQPGFKHTIIIEPQMSFGTGHHETTRLMINQMCSMVFKDKIVLDMGCGTGILGIIAVKEKAKYVTAMDIDPWSSENTKSNLKLNEVNSVDVFRGDATSIPGKPYDIILANINKNVLLEDIPKYAEKLTPNGELLVSGFYTSDEKAIEIICNNQRLTVLNILRDNSWSSMRLSFN